MPLIKVQSLDLVQKTTFVVVARRRWLAPLPALDEGLPGAPGDLCSPLVGGLIRRRSRTLVMLSRA